MSRQENERPKETVQDLSKPTYQQEVQAALSLNKKQGALSREEIDQTMERLAEWLEQLNRMYFKPPLKAESVIRSGKMSSKEYYIGLPARLEDMDGERLMMMYYTVETKQSREAAENFAVMVLRSDNLAATAFIEDVNALVAADWKYIPTKKPRKKSIHHATIIDYLEKSDYEKSFIDQTYLIQEQFTQLLHESGNFPEKRMAKL